MTFEELKAALFVRSNFGMKLGLTRMREALRLLGDPHRGYAVLHVAGTNGKGSTCAFAEASLRAAGLRTGLYTSPHLIHFCERIRVSGTPISEERAADLFEEILGKVPWALEDEGLTFFEIATLMAFLEFTRSEVDVAVVEVGLGGRLDATNVVEPLACAISSLGLDHLQWLGPTLAHVAAEKAGIFKQGVPAVSAGQVREAAEVLERRAGELRIPLWRPGRDYRFESRTNREFCYESASGFCVRPRAPLALAGSHQRTNAALSCALLEAAAARGLRVVPRHVEEGLVGARWQARLEPVARDPLVLVDGAHNGHAARALLRSLPDILRGRPLHLVMAAMADKDHADLVGPLVPLARTLHFCAASSPRAADPRVLAAASGRSDARVHASPADALEAARAAAGRDGVVLCCGSLYLAGEIAAAQEKRAPASMPSERL
ncbi:MAG: bifunctional folylpolyglutamate synthase/dihydrofolate synthase [Myxococcales bacterium]